MQDTIHPAYQEVTVACSCGNTFQTRSALNKAINLDVCSKCHPFYTGQQKMIDTEGRVDGFRKKFANFGNRMAQRKTTTAQ